MSGIRLYTYEKCGTCRKAMKWLKARGIKATPTPIRAQPPSAAELKQMLQIHGGALRKLFNTSGRDYKELKLADKMGTMTEAEAIALLSRNGNLVKRPFLLVGTKGAVGFDEKAWASLFAP